MVIDAGAALHRLKYTRRHLAKTLGGLRKKHPNPGVSTKNARMLAVYHCSCVCFGGGRSACTGSYTDKSLALNVNDELFEQYRAKQDEVVEQRHWDSEAAQAMIAAKARAA
jgi:hypothetical protein